jgi:hypothetical protein
VSKNTALTYLDCNNNILTSLDVSKNTALTYLDCRSNHLYALDVSKNTALTTLKCYDNQLAALDVSKNTALTGLDCNDNQLTALDVSKNTALTGLHCFNNRLAALDLSKNPMITSFQGYKNSRTIKVYSYTRSAVHGGGTGYYVPLTAQAAITLKDGTHYGATKALATLIYDAGQMGDPAFDITKVVSGTWGGATLGTFNGTQVLLLDANAKAITYQYNTGFTGTCTYWYAYSSGDKTTVTAPNAYFTLNWVATTTGSDPGVVTDVDGVDSNDVSVYTTAGAINIGGSFDGNVDVYNMRGQQVYCGTDSEIAVPAGMYVVKVNDKAHKVLVR